MYLRVGTVDQGPRPTNTEAQSGKNSFKGRLVGQPEVKGRNFLALNQGQQFAEAVGVKQVPK